MNDKIKAALNKEQDDEKKQEEQESAALSPVEPKVDAAPNEVPLKNKVITTAEEIESYVIIKSILSTVVDSSRITFRDTASYFGIRLDNSNRKWICRVHLMSFVRYITIADENKNAIRKDIDNLDDIFDHSELIIKACKNYI